jgi:hypothetical protein
MQWYYSKNTTQMGPVSIDELRSKLGLGEVAGTDLVWREGMVDWRPASSVDELRAALVRNPFVVPPVAGTDGSSPYAPPGAPGSSSGMSPALPTSGLAIASLICGIMGLISCMFLPGIPAVICGHMALKRIEDPAARLTGRGIAIAGLIMGYGAILILAGLLLMMFIGILTS